MPNPGVDVLLVADLFMARLSTDFPFLLFVRVGFGNPFFMDEIIY